jgi:hypothetical protein
MDMRSKGRSAQLIFDRSDLTAGRIPSFPGDSRQANRALTILDGLETSFAQRLQKAKDLGHEDEIEMLSLEIELIGQAANKLSMVLKAYCLS